MAAFPVLEFDKKVGVHRMDLSACTKSNNILKFFRLNLLTP